MQTTINETNTYLRAEEGKVLTDGQTYCHSIYIVHTTITETIGEGEEEQTITRRVPADISHWREVDASLAPKEPIDRNALIAESNQYAEGRKVVHFHGTDRWLTPSERANYRNALTAAEQIGISEIPIYGITLTPSQGIAILNAVEVYAMQVTLRAQQHAETIASIAEEALDAYDYTAGYPPVLTFGEDVATSYTPSEE